MDDLSGRVLGGRYRVESFLGRGGMADVYKVWDNQRAVHLAMKILHDDLAEDVVFLRRFKREAHLLERLQHPNIVRFYGLEESDGLAFILMDFIDGLTLRKEIYLSKKGMRPERILQLLRPVCAALYYAHQMGMVHCDIKPANVMIHRNSMVYLADFGIARFTENNTTTMMGAGTPAYMAPEQIQGKESSPASDIYALGVVLFEMITGGERPFTGEMAQNSGNTTQKIVWEKRYLPPPSPRKFCQDLDPELEAVVMCCLAREPQDRYATALELLHALESAVRQADPNGDAMTLPDLSRDLENGEDLNGFLDVKEENLASPGESEMDQVVLLAREAPKASGGEPVAHAKLAERKATRLFDLRKPARMVALGIILLVIVVSIIFLTMQQGVAGISANTRTPHPASQNIAGEAPGIAHATSTPTATLLLPTPTPTITFTPEPTPLGGGAPGSQGWIAFASDRNGSVQIWMMDTHGKNHYQLTTVEGGACQPAWSPDGKELAFITPCNGPRPTYPGSSLRILNLDSGNIMMPNFSGGGFDPAWSPDGKTIAFTALAENGLRTEIHALNVETGEVSVLAKRGNKCANPTWSPDGEHIIFTSDKQGVDVLWMMRKNGGSQEPFSQAGLLKYFTEPAWSPDGKWVMATLKELNVNVFTLVRFDASDPLKNETSLIDELFHMEDGSYSPDSRHVVFWTKENSNMEILRLDPDGELTPLASNDSRDFHPAWSPVAP